MTRWTMAALLLGACALSLPAAAQAPPISGNSVRGGGVSGPLNTKKCPPAAECPMKVLAAIVSADEDDDDELDCFIRVPVAKLLHKQTTSIKWTLAPKAIARGFTFAPPYYVVIDSGGTHFNAPVPGPAPITSVSVTRKTGTPANAFSYTVYLQLDKGGGIPTKLCKGYDPMIVNQDN